LDRLTLQKNDPLVLEEQLQKDEQHLEQKLKVHGIAILYLFLHDENNG
jgi:hypothetical protein